MASNSTTTTTTSSSSTTSPGKALKKVQEKLDEIQADIRKKEDELEVFEGDNAKMEYKKLSSAKKEYYPTVVLYHARLEKKLDALQQKENTLQQEKLKLLGIKEEELKAQNKKAPAGKLYNCMRHT